ncbi:putative Type I inositol polyphosphate 5-phosphatase [Quillaja saponaria]|uniref:Type I inositol polyphosphate 5-phosphatase n=1 Tax=Quillaja saponaria TaxID=32244 RepID=A0AAD7L0R4_QUISA|nr:putative Type I inositol polyphosphate 5-phosphatase [Quillaja saponaria]
MTQRNQDDKKESSIRRFFTTRERNERKMKGGSFDSSEAVSGSSIEIPLFTGAGAPMPSGQNLQSFRVFVATWNVGGKCPHRSLNLDDFLQINNQSDIYVLGFQEIVPLNAGNVLVLEDNEPAAKWLDLINHSLNKSAHVASRVIKSAASFGGSLFFSKPSLKKISKTFRTESKRKLKACNCPLELERKTSMDFCFRCQESNISEDDSSSEEDDETFPISIAQSSNQMKYGLIASKQMVGIFVTVWMRKELVQHVGHLRISCITRGIMGYLGNKGCISVSMSFHQTSFCFICSHLASGEKEGDELRRNLDVIEILKNTQFRRICKSPYSRMPEKILEHDRIIWFGDLNYRIALSYSDAKKLMEGNDWDSLLDKDQLKIEREAGRAFEGWKEGKIYFAPTYKYSFNSDTYYAAEMNKSKTKRRTPAWCDRILWYGNGIQQLSYIRKEFRFSDHRPVCANFLVEVEVIPGGLKKKLSGSNMKIEVEELLSPSSPYNMNNMY